MYFIKFAIYYSIQAWSILGDGKEKSNTFCAISFF